MFSAGQYRLTEKCSENFGPSIRKYYYIKLNSTKYFSIFIHFIPFPSNEKKNCI